LLRRSGDEIRGFAQTFEDSPDLGVGIGIAPVDVGECDVEVLADIRDEVRCITSREDACGRAEASR